MAQANPPWRKVLAGHPSYEVTGGEVLFDGKNLLEMDADERAREGVFMAFQYPVEIPEFPTRQFCVWPITKAKHLARRTRSFEFKIC